MGKKSSGGAGKPRPTPVDRAACGLGGAPLGLLGPDVIALVTLSLLSSQASASSSALTSEGPESWPGVGDSSPVPTGVPLPPLLPSVARGLCDRGEEPLPLPLPLPVPSACLSSEPPRDMELGLSPGRFLSPVPAARCSARARARALVPARPLPPVPVPVPAPLAPCPLCAPEPPTAEGNMPAMPAWDRGMEGRPPRAIALTDALVTLLPLRV